MPRYTEDDGLKALAADIIAKRRPYLKELSIGYLFRPEAAVSNGRTIAGMCIRVDDRNRTIHELDFLIEIAKDVWDDASNDFRRAIMDHELGHCGVRLDEQGNPIRDDNTDRIRTYVKPHDIEEFADVLETYGSYHVRLREFLDGYARAKAKKDAAAAAKQAAQQAAPQPAQGSPAPSATQSA